MEGDVVRGEEVNDSNRFGRGKFYLACLLVKADTHFFWPMLRYVFNVSLVVHFIICLLLLYLYYI